MTDLLRVEGLAKAFGELRATDGVDLALPAGRLTAIIGPNGAGKSTLINLVTGALVADAGRIRFRDEDVTAWSAHQRVRAGLSRSFQLINVFPRLTVLQNLLIPVLAHAGRAHRPFARLARHRAEVEEAEALLVEIGLGDRRDHPAGILSHGDQRLLELGVAVAPRPVLCFLDEPSAGLTPAERSTVMELVRRLARERSTTFAIVEHDMDVVFALADWIVVMNRGRVLAEGPPGVIREHREVREVYLGEEVL